MPKVSKRTCKTAGVTIAVGLGLPDEREAGHLAADAADGDGQCFGGGVGGAVLGNVLAEAFAVPVFGDDERGDVAVLDRGDHRAVGAPHHVRRPGGAHAPSDRRRARAPGPTAGPAPRADRRGRKR